MVIAAPLGVVLAVGAATADGDAISAEGVDVTAGALEALIPESEVGAGAATEDAEVRRGVDAAADEEGAATMDDCARAEEGPGLEASTWPEGAVGGGGVPGLASLPLPQGTAEPSGCVALGAGDVAPDGSEMAKRPVQVAGWPWAVN